jgi:hypothetical protein
LMHQHHFGMLDCPIFKPPKSTDVRAAARIPPAARTPRTVAGEGY